MCRVFKVSPSGFYAWNAREPSARAIDNARLSARIRAIHARSYGTYGSPRIHAELADEGELVGHNRVARLMKIAGIEGVSRRRWVSTTIRDPKAQPSADLVQRDFEADRPNRLWVADITYIPTWAGFLYLAVVLDAFSRKIVVWTMAEHLRTELVLAALNMALGQRRAQGVVHHSDHGTQGEFKPSSQHVLIGGCDGNKEGAVSTGRTCEDEVAREASGAASIGAPPVLACDRQWLLERRSGSKIWGFIGCRGQMVSGVWRYAAIASFAVSAADLGTVFVAG